MYEHFCSYNSIQIGRASFGFMCNSVGCVNLLPTTWARTREDTEHIDNCYPQSIITCHSTKAVALAEQRKQPAQGRRASDVTD